MRPKADIPEQEIAGQIIEGKTNDEIGRVINRKKKTVDDYIHRLLRKYGCRNRTELAVNILGLNL